MNETILEEIVSKIKQVESKLDQNFVDLASKFNALSNRIDSLESFIQGFSFIHNDSRLVGQAINEAIVQLRTDIAALEKDALPVNKWKLNKKAEQIKPPPLNINWKGKELIVSPSLLKKCKGDLNECARRIKEFENKAIQEMEMFIDGEKPKPIATTNQKAFPLVEKDGQLMIVLPKSEWDHKLPKFNKKDHRKETAPKGKDQFRSGNPWKNAFSILRDLFAHPNQPKGGKQHHRKQK